MVNKYKNVLLILFFIITMNALIYVLKIRIKEENNVSFNASHRTIYFKINAFFPTVKIWKTKTQH